MANRDDYENARGYVVNASRALLETLLIEIDSYPQDVRAAIVRLRLSLNHLDTVQAITGEPQ